VTSKVMPDFTWREGDACKVLHGREIWEPGTIKNVNHDGTYEILYEKDATMEKTVDGANLQPRMPHDDKTQREKVIFLKARRYRTCDDEQKILMHRSLSEVGGVEDKWLSSVEITRNKKGQALTETQRLDEEHKSPATIEVKHLDALRTLRTNAASSADVEATKLAPVEGLFSSKEQGQDDAQSTSASASVSAAFASRTESKPRIAWSRR